MTRFLCLFLSIFSLYASAESFMLKEKPERFDGTVALFDCSGFVFKFENMPTSKNAFVMTNGHCIIPLPLPFLMLKDQEFQTSQLFDHRRIKIFNQSEEKLILRTQNLAYATMTGTDMGIYKLNISYDVLKEKYGISPLVLSKTAPKIGDSVEVISAYRLSVYACSVESIVHELEEGGRHFNNSIRLNSECETRGGTSGSPIVLTGTNKVVGINNTLNKKGKLCGSDNPCEISEQGEVKSFRGARYGQQTSLLYSCVNKDFDIDLTIPTCEITH